MKDLRGGSIGFDPFRDPRTSTKASILSFIVHHHDNDSIVAAINRLTTSDGITAARTSSQAHANDIPFDTTQAADGTNSPVVAQVSIDTASAGQQIAAILASIKTTPAMDENSVKGIVAAQVTGLLSTVQDMLDKITAPTRVEITNTTTGATHDCGICHRSFPSLLKAMSARDKDGNRLNIWVYGPAGTGKTLAAHLAAKALNLEFRFCGALSTEYELLGYSDATGKAVRTPFREAYEHGGVMLLDEIEASSKKALLRLNAALANGVCPFPDGMVARHKDCCIIAGASTLGKGATNDYGAREKQDESLLDRFVYLAWPIDEKLETATAPNPEWTKKVQAWRHTLTQREIKGHMITPRASYMGAALLAAGLPEDAVIQMAVRKGMSDDQWNQIAGAV